MVEQLFPDLYRIEVPLPGNPLKAINCYLIRGSDRDLLIDTGMNMEECRTAMDAALRELDVDLHRTDIFLTHMHSDHTGLASYLARPTSNVYITEVDSWFLNRDLPWDLMAARANRHGFPEQLLHEAVGRHPGRRFAPPKGLKLTMVKEGDLLEIGRYSFRCIETPGHTKGHVCLYDVTEELFISGDHVLDRITPNISVLNDEENPLADYIRSLDKVAGLPVKLVLPSHRNNFSYLRHRVEQLKHHHERRSTEILAILADESPLDAYGVAARMKWDLSYTSWDQFPVPQRWFAQGEALAHLRYLEDNGTIARVAADPVVKFALASQGV